MTLCDFGKKVLDFFVSNSEEEETILFVLDDDSYSRLFENNDDKNVLVVAHSHTIKALTSAVDSNLYRFDQRLDNCSITIFDCDGKNVNVLDYNIKTQ